MDIGEKIMVYVFLAQGFEEIEALTAVDLLRRAEIPVKTVSIEGGEVTGSHNITVKADMLLSDITEDFDAVILPGGMPGTTNLNECSNIHEILDIANKNQKLICAICAAPMILGMHGLLKGKKATSYPGFEKYLEGAILSEERVCSDGNIITSRGAGTAAEFAAAIITALEKKETAEEILKSILHK